MTPNPLPPSSAPETANLDSLEGLASNLMDQLWHEFEKRLNQMLSASPLNRLLTVKDVAAYLNISPRKVEDIIKLGQLTPLLVGKQRRFTPDAVEAYIRNHAAPVDRGPVRRRRR